MRFHVAAVLVLCVFVFQSLHARESDDWPVVSSAAEIDAMGSAVTELRVVGADDAALEALSSHLQIRRLDLGRREVWQRHYTDDGVKHLAKLTNLEWLEISSSYVISEPQITDAGIQHLAKLNELRHLDVGGRNWLGAKSFKLFAGLPNLRSLDAIGCAAFDDACMEALAAAKALRILRISVDGGSRGHWGESEWLEGVTNSGMAWIGDMKGLRELYIDGIAGNLTGKSVNNAALARLSQLPNLEVLHIPGCDNFDEKGLRWLTKCKKLCQLDIGGSPVNDAGLEYVSQIENLRVLDIGVCEKCTGTGFAHLGKLPKLETLIANRCAGASDRGLAGLADSPNLRRLTLGGSQGYYFGYAGGESKWREGDKAACTPEGLTELGKIQTLEHLNLSSIDIVNDDVCEALSKLPNLHHLEIDPRGDEHLPLTDRGLVALSSCASLRVLDIYDAPNVTEEGVAALATLKFLGTLKLSRCGEIKSATVVELSRLQNLRELSIGGAELGLEGLQALGRMRSLEVLDIWQTTDLPYEGFKHLTRLEHLRELNLNFCDTLQDDALKHIGQIKTLTDLRLCGVDSITDEGIAHLTKLKLTYINLGSCAKLTNRTLDHLANIPTLRAMTLGDPPHMTREAIERLESLLPKCDINWHRD